MTALTKDDASRLQRYIASSTSADVERMVQTIAVRKGPQPQCITEMLVKLEGVQLAAVIELLYNRANHLKMGKRRRS